MNFRDLGRDLRALADERDRTPENAIPELQRLKAIGGRHYEELGRRGALGFSAQRMGLDDIRQLCPRLADPIHGDEERLYAMGFGSAASSLAHHFPDRLGEALTLGGRDRVVKEATETARVVSGVPNPARWRDDGRSHAAVCDLLWEWEDAAMADRDGPRDPALVATVAETFRREAEMFNADDPSATLKDDRTPWLVEQLDRLADAKSLPRPIRKRLPWTTIFRAPVENGERWRVLVAGLVKDNPERFHPDDAKLGWQTFEADGPMNWTREGNSMPEGWDPEKDGGGMQPGDSGTRGVVNTTGRGMDAADWARYARKRCRLDGEVCVLIAETLERSCGHVGDGERGGRNAENAARPVPLTKDHFAIMETLREHNGRCLQVNEVVSFGVIRNRETAGNLLNFLAENGLAEQPHGARKGYVLTAEGESRLRTRPS